MVRPFIINHRHFSSVSHVTLKPGQLWSSLSLNRRILRGPRKKALLIAINYTYALDPQHRLKGPQKEVQRFKALLLKRYGYSESAIMVMTDAPGTAAHLIPTMENILREVKALLEHQEPGDHYLFYFAGHSFQQETEDKDELDGKNELIMPLDAFPSDAEVDDTKAIVDNELKEHLVERLHAKSRLVAIFDSCHSGTLLDLPHYKCNRVSNSISRFRRMGRRCLEILRHDYVPFGMIEDAVTPIGQKCKGTKGGYGKGTECAPSLCSGFCRRPKGIKNNVICLSACKDSQQTWEYDFHSMTSALVDFLEKKRKRRPTLKKLMRVVSLRRPELAEVKEFWTPELSSRYPARVDSFFKL
ncbi:caspase domain-containing protein [Lyophyllum atratum]|nr:caspase domain-containing protein [Lyophyllum atratum]